MSRLKQYRVLSPIPFAARSWNAGETVTMSGNRAQKFLDANQIEPVAASPKPKSSDKES